MDGNIIAIGATDSNLGLLIIIDMVSNKELLRNKAHEEKVFSVACEPNGRFVVSGSSDGKVKVWPLDNSMNDIKPL